MTRGARVTMSLGRESGTGVRGRESGRPCHQVPGRRRARRPALSLPSGGAWEASPRWSRNLLATGGALMKATSSSRPAQRGTRARRRRRPSGAAPPRGSGREERAGQVAGPAGWARTRRRARPGVRVAARGGSRVGGRRGRCSAPAMVARRHVRRRLPPWHHPRPVLRDGREEAVVARRVGPRRRSQVWMGAEDRSIGTGHRKAPASADDTPSGTFPLSDRWL